MDNTRLSQRRDEVSYENVDRGTNFVGLSTQLCGDLLISISFLMRSNQHFERNLSRIECLTLILFMYFVLC